MFQSFRKTNISHSGQMKEVRFSIYDIYWYSILVSFPTDILKSASRNAGNFDMSHSAFESHQRDILLDVIGNNIAVNGTENY
jgi:hypothetical protein